MAQVQHNLVQNFPRVRCAGVLSPPFKVWDDADYQEMARVINESGAHLVFVALGCPKQEKWMYAQLGKIHAVMLGVGWAFYVLAGTHQRAPKWMQDFGLEWLYRLYLEPTRLFKRYCLTNSLFLILILRQFFHLKMIKTDR